jgi:hypothetical protein
MLTSFFYGQLIILTSESLLEKVTATCKSHSDQAVGKSSSDRFCLLTDWLVIFIESKINLLSGANAK